VKRKDLQDLASIRLKEADVLLLSRHWEGAYYLAGYAAECALKACIAKRTARHDFPDKERVNASHTHNLEKLVELAGLKDSLENARQSEPKLHVNWSVVTEWWEQSRYERPSQSEAEGLLRALVERKHGVFTWLKRHW